MQICTNRTKQGRFTSQFQLVLLVGLIWIAALGALGCERCSPQNPLGRLLEKSGVVERDTAAQLEVWSTASKGAEFGVGDAVRTKTTATAQVALDDGSVLVMEGDTLIRFLERPPGSTEHALDLSMGSAVIEASTQSTTVVTSFGTAQILGGSKLRLERKADQLTFKVMVGTAKLESEGGTAMSLQAGQVVVARLGSAVLEEASEVQEAPLPIEEEITPPSGPITAQVQGQNVRIRGPSDAAFSSFPPGTQAVSQGSTVEVGARSSVTVSQGSSTAVLSSGGSYVLGADGQLVRATSGSFKVESATKLRLAVPGGFIETTAGAAQVTALGAQGTQVLVERGEVQLVGKTRETLLSGDEGTIALDGSVKVEGRGLDHFDLEIGPGQSLVIHDPHPPTAIAFHFGKMCTQGVVRLKSKAKASLPGGSVARGTKWVALPVAQGRVDYTLACIAESGEEQAVSARGSVTVLADAGNKPAPLQAPSTTVDANGRSYTVLYQNQLPQVALRWPGAPSGVSSFTIKRASAGVSRSYTSSQPSYFLASGSLPEGSHRFYFEGGGRVSRLTTVNIIFDNATPTASLQTPVNAGGAPGSPLRLNGSVLPGWAISVDGRAVNPDAEGRFSVMTQMPPQGRPALLFLSHPTRGAHVYLRRSAGAR